MNGASASTPAARISRKPVRQRNTASGMISFLSDPPNAVLAYTASLVGEAAENAYRMLGRYSEGLAFLDEAASCALHAEVRFYDAEILRIRGDLIAVLGDTAEAERCYRQALELATSQGAGSLRARIEASLGSVRRSPAA